MTNHTDLINFLINKNKSKSYLEIGVQRPSKNFDKIKVKSKVGVDPDPNALATFKVTSDQFFKTNKSKFDVIFIDGLHEANQVQRDFENALACLDDGGFIVLHDCNPTDEAVAKFPRTVRGVWNGDVYKFAISLNNYDGIDFCTVDFDHGCAVVWRDETKKAAPEPVMEIKHITWEYFVQHKDLLRLTSPQDFKNKW